MTNVAKAFVANYVWLPYGGLHSYTGTTEVDLRFPGQLMQAESGLYYNWNRQYDPTTGRYTQADPLGLVDGSSRYAYVGNDPLQQVDPEGQTGLTVIVLPDGSLEFNPPFNDPLSGAICSTATPPFIYYPEPRQYTKFQLMIELLRGAVSVSN
jgi:RHS repeat-associated protein